MCHSMTSRGLDRDNRKRTCARTHMHAHAQTHTPPPPPPPPGAPFIDGVSIDHSPLQDLHIPRKQHRVHRFGCVFLFDHGVRGMFCSVLLLQEREHVRLACQRARPEQTSFCEHHLLRHGGPRERAVARCADGARACRAVLSGYRSSRLPFSACRACRCEARAVGTESPDRTTGGVSASVLRYFGTFSGFDPFHDGNTSHHGPRGSIYDDE